MHVSILEICPGGAPMTETISMLDRRAFLLSSAAAGAAFAIPAWAQQPTAQPSELDALFDRIFQEDLRRRPESATQLGLDKGDNADLRGRLSDDSAAGRAAGRVATQDQLRRLAAIDRSALSAADKVNYDTVVYTRESAAKVQAFDFGGAGYGPSPYVVSQMTGAYQSVPDFLDTKHKIENAADADAYLSRLWAYGDQLDANSDRFRHDAGLGVIPPDFLLDTALVQMEKLRVPAAEALVVTSLAKRAKAKGLPDSYAAEAAKIYDAEILPALDRQIALTRELRAKTTSDAGIWRFKQGAQFYEVALHNTTTTRMSAREVHRFGLDQAKAISSRLDGLLRAQGMTKGSVGARMAALYADPRQLYPNSDEGKLQAIAYCNARLDAIRRRSGASRPTASKCAACRCRPRLAPPPPLHNPPRSMARGRAWYISTCTTARNGRNSASRRRCTTRVCRAISSKAGSLCRTARCR